MTTTSIKFKPSTAEREAFLEQLVAKFDELLGDDHDERMLLKEDSDARRKIWNSISDDDKKFLVNEVFASEQTPADQISMAVLHGTFMDACRRWTKM